MEFLGYFLFVGMGVILGLLGAGGSILALPILIYVFKIPVVTATTYSLFIVGISAALSVFRSKKEVVFKKALIFAVPSISAMVMTRRYIIYSLPENIGWLSLDVFLIGLLVTTMLGASYFMIHDKKDVETENVKIEDDLNFFKFFKVATIGFILGFFMGLLGAGGGFLIIPALVLLLNIPMQQAVPTSLFIITINALMGFAVDQHSLEAHHYKALLLFTALSFIGMGIGIYARHIISGNHLKKGFGFFMAVIAFFIAITELYTRLI